MGGNTQSVQQAVSQITQFVSNGGDNIGQPLGRQQVETLLSPALSEQLPSKASLSNTSIQPPPPPQPQPQPIEQLTLPQATPSQSYNITSGVRESNTPLPNQQVHSLQQQNLVQPTPTNNDLQLSSNVANDMCTSLPINTITANGDDGTNKPINAIDNNLNTRWSNLGVGSWIQTDLGTSKVICSVDIAWYRGNVRQNNFAISVSNDSSTFTKNVFTGKSSGTTLSSESYSFAQISARYVRITVNGNTENNWASISEIKVNGNSTQPPPSNRPPITNAGPDQIVNESSLVTLDGSASHDPDGDQLTYAWTQTGGNPVVLNNANTTKATFTAPSVMSNDIVLLFKLTVTDKAGLSSTDTVQITVTHATNSGNGVDKFGIKEIYPTKQGGEEWFVNMNNPNDGRNKVPSSLSKNPDGTFKIKSTQVRWGVFTTSGYHRNQISTYNHSN